MGSSNSLDFGQKYDYSNLFPPLARNHDSDPVPPRLCDPYALVQNYTHQWKRTYKWNRQWIQIPSLTKVREETPRAIPKHVELQMVQCKDRTWASTSLKLGLMVPKATPLIKSPQHLFQNYIWSITNLSPKCEISDNNPKVFATQPPSILLDYLVKPLYPWIFQQEPLQKDSPPPPNPHPPKHHTNTIRTCPNTLQRSMGFWSGIDLNPIF